MMGLKTNSIESENVKSGWHGCCALKEEGGKTSANFWRLRDYHPILTEN